MDVRNLLSLSGVLLVLGTAGYYWGLGHQREIPVGNDQARLPDYVVTGIGSVETDAQGLPLRRLQARELRHYDQPRDEAEIDNPIFTLYEKGREAWQVSAPRGVSRNQNTEVRLEGGVHAERRDPAALPVTLDTAELVVYPREERLMTQSDVKIDSPQGRLSSHGLQASMKTGDLILTENVTGNYAPASR